MNITYNRDSQELDFYGEFIIFEDFDEEHEPIDDSESLIMTSEDLMFYGMYNQDAFNDFLSLIYEEPDILCYDLLDDGIETGIPFVMKLTLRLEKDKCSACSDEHKYYGIISSEFVKYISEE